MVRQRFEPGVMICSGRGFLSQQQACDGDGGRCYRAVPVAAGLAAGRWSGIGRGCGAFRGAQAWDESLLHSQMASRYGEAGVRRLQAWLRLLQAQQAQNPPQQLVAINDFWNVNVLAGGSEHLA